MKTLTNLSMLMLRIKYTNLYDQMLAVAPSNHSEG